MATLALNLTFDEAFKIYRESWSGDCLCFKGVLREDYAGASDLRVIDFVSGGRRFRHFDLSRDGARVEGKVFYFPFTPTLSNEDVKADEELVRKIRLVVDKGTPIVDAAYYFNVPYETVVSIKRRKGAFKGV